MSRQNQSRVCTRRADLAVVVLEPSVGDAFKRKIFIETEPIRSGAAGAVTASRYELEKFGVFEEERAADPAGLRLRTQFGVA